MNTEKSPGPRIQGIRKQPITTGASVPQPEMLVNGTGAGLSLLTFAREAVRLGFCVLPTVPGEKRPDVKKWGPYQQERPTLEELAQWFTAKQHGIGVVTGNVSGNLEALDFDDRLAFTLYCEIAERAEIGELLRRVMDGYQDESPKGGHLLYRCAEIASSQALTFAYARDEAGALTRTPDGKPIKQEKPLIETRGEGGFLVIPPSHGRTHPSGKPYVQVSGGLSTVATISPAERQLLLGIARGMNEVIEEPKSDTRDHATQNASDGTRPGDLYNAQVTWAHVLVRHGWVAVFERAGVTYWRRPGKDRGISATTGYAGTDYLYVFSTSTDFERERGYSKFSAFTLLNHNGDFVKAAEALLRRGYFPRGEEPPAPEEDVPASGDITQEPPLSEDEENARMFAQERELDDDEEVAEGAEAFSAEEEERSTSAADTEEQVAEEPYASPPDAGDPRPKIRITTRITHVVNEAEHALLAFPNGPHLFQRIGQLCFVTHSAIPPKWLKRPLGAPSIASCSPTQLRERMSRAADWYKYVARTKEWTLSLPPEWAVETLHGRQEWHFPVLADVISAPTLREDGEIISAPGYDPDTGLFLDTQGVIFPTIPMRPTLDDAVRAVKALMEPIVDFPFAGPSDRSAAVAAVPSTIVRPTIHGNMPLFAAISTTRGTGKGLLIDEIAISATSRPAPRWAQSQDAEEDRKALLTIGMEGDQCVHIDNLTHALGSGPLDSALTAGVIKGRLLGLNKSAEVPMSCVFFASGNNMSFAGDMARRVVPIHLESLLERPEDRDDFQQPRLLEWVRQERPRLVVAALTLLKAYFVAGRPKQGITAYGSFEEWSDLIRSALIWAGCADPCEGRKNIEAESDLGYENLARLLHCWGACYENKAVTLSSVIGDVGQRAAEIIPNEWNELRDALAAFDDRYDGKRLDSKRIGLGLRGIKGRVVGGQRLIQAGKAQGGVILWALQKV